MLGETLQDISNKCFSEILMNRRAHTKAQKQDKTEWWPFIWEEALLNAFCHITISRKSSLKFVGTCLKDLTWNGKACLMSYDDAINEL